MCERDGGCSRISGKSKSRWQTTHMVVVPPIRSRMAVEPCVIMFHSPQFFDARTGMPKGGKLDQANQYVSRSR